MTIFVVSDTHFNHKNIIRYSDRPFDSVEEMNEALVDNWNSVVTPQDKAYHLGDVIFGKDYSILKRLNGKKRLIVGNHDDIKSLAKAEVFQKIYMWRIFREFEITLTHVPLHLESLRTEINVHGHTHEKGSPSGPYKSACVELTNYTPKPIEEFTT